MNDTLVPITTTPVPMQGYDDRVVGSEWVTTRLHTISEALRHQGRADPRIVTVREGTSNLRRQRPYSVRRAQTPALDWFSLPLRAEPGQPVTTMTGLESVGCEFARPFYEVFVSFLIAALKAKARGDLTRPLILSGMGRSGEKTDLRIGQWVLQFRTTLQRALDDFRSEPVTPRKVEHELSVAGFLEEVYGLAVHDLQSATDRVFDKIDRLLCDGREDVCDEILARVDVTRLPTALLRSFLTITAPAKGRLPSRRSLFAKAYGEMVRQRGPEMAQRLLDRLA
jgi:hypothetical protein